MTLLLAVSPAALRAQPDKVVDLATVSPADGVARWAYGASGTGVFGVPVAGTGDTDGDGLNDYAIAFMTADPLARANAGEVDLFFGDGTVAGFVDTAVDQPDLLRVYGAHAAETAGNSIWMDDVDGDGLADLLICRQYHSPPARDGAGALTILFGDEALRKRAATLSPIDLDDPPADIPMTTLIGAAAVDRFCIWVRTGDVDGDGTADLVVGADQEDAIVDKLLEVHRGAVYVIRGGDHLRTENDVDLSLFGATELAGNVAKLTPPPGSAHYHFGATCQLGDLDGNGKAEVMAAAALNRAGASLQPPSTPGGGHGTGGALDGTLYIAWDDNFPAPPWPAGYSFDIGSSPGRRSIINGADENISFGEEILPGADYDGDDTPDLFVGDLVGDGTDPMKEGPRPASGIGYVFFDAAQLADLEIDLESPPDEPELVVTRILGPVSGAIGADTAGKGDFDADGFDDVVFASPHADPQGRTDAGALHVLFGRQGGWPALVDLADAEIPTPAVLRVVEIQGAHGTSGQDTGDTLSYSAAVGDVDADGYDDYITNEMVGNGLAPAAEDVGNLIILSGKRLAAIFADGFESGDTTVWSATMP